MKYINASICCYNSINRNEQSQITSCHNPFNTIMATHSPCPTPGQAQYFIGDFDIDTQISIMGTNNPDHFSENPISSDKIFEITIRLTKCAKDSDSQIGIDLDSFQLDLKDLKKKHKLTKACYHFLNYRRITHIRHIDLVGGPGQYVLKVLIKDLSLASGVPQKETIQTMNVLHISSPTP